jgi:hypothetical protein
LRFHEKFKLFMKRFSYRQARRGLSSRAMRKPCQTVARRLELGIAKLVGQDEGGCPQEDDVRTQAGKPHLGVPG